MAAELTVPAVTRVNRPISIAATGFEADGTLVISVEEMNVSGSFTLDTNGDLADPSPFTWAPSKEGVYTVKATDGTDTLTASVQVYSTT